MLLIHNQRIDGIMDKYKHEMERKALAKEKGIKVEELEPLESAPKKKKKGGKKKKLRSKSKAKKGSS